jgi:hypothetical protein
MVNGEIVCFVVVEGGVDACWRKNPKHSGFLQRFGTRTELQRHKTRTLKGLRLFYNYCIIGDGAFDGTQKIEHDIFDLMV